MSRLLKSLIVGGSFMGLGILLYNKTTPTEEQLVRELSPELRARYYNEKQTKRLRNDLEKHIREAKDDVPIWKKEEDFFREHPMYNERGEPINRVMAAPVFSMDGGRRKENLDAAEVAAVKRHAEKQKAQRELNSAETSEGESKKSNSSWFWS